MRTLRLQALEQIAALSAANACTSFDRSDLDRLCKSCPRQGRTYGDTTVSLGPVPMTMQEYDVLLALCKAVPGLGDAAGAQKVAIHLVSYLMDTHQQVFAPSPLFRSMEPCPTEAMTFHVTAALLSLGSQHAHLQQIVSDKMAAFLDTCADACETVSRAVDEAGLEYALRTGTIALALLGFLDAACAQADFWRAGGRLGLISRLRDLLSPPFLVAVESAMSTIRNRHTHLNLHASSLKQWRRWLRHHDDTGRPLGALLLQRSFMRLLVAATSLLVAEPDALRRWHILDIHMTGHGLRRPVTGRSGEVDFRSVETCAILASDQMKEVESSADFDSLSPAKQKLASAVKAAALVSYLNAFTLNEDAADGEVLMTWLENSLEDPVGMADEELSFVVLRCMTVICRLSPAYALTVSRLLPRFIVQSKAESETVMTASQCLASVLQMLSTDAVITTLYTLGNVLGSGSDGVDGRDGEADGTDGTDETGSNDAADPYWGTGTSAMYRARHSGSSISLQVSGEEESSVVHGNVVQAICEIATAARDDKITGLAQSMLAQKMARMANPTDGRLMTGAARLALSGGQAEFRHLLRRYGIMAHEAVVEGRQPVLDFIRKARNYLSANMSRDSPLYDMYLEHLLDAIISQGDAHGSGQAKDADMELAAAEIARLLQPLALLMAKKDMASDEGDGGDGGDDADDGAHNMLRDAWFNMTVHGFNAGTDRGRRHVRELRVIALHSPPLVSEKRGEQNESDIDLNPILRRGEGSEREAMQKRQLAELVPSRSGELRALSYRNIIFLHAVFLLETLRAEGGDCTKAVSYFVEPSMRRGDASRTMDAILATVMDRYLARTLDGTSPALTATRAASQLAALFCSCCHRIERVQQAAFWCADAMMDAIPSTLCQKTSVFALLELLSLLWSACLEADTDRYEPRTRFTSALGKVTVALSDDFRFRHQTLEQLQAKARTWLAAAVDMAPAHVKGLLQTYLSEHEDEVACGNVSLGRCLAVEMGSRMPASDQRLSSLRLLGRCPVSTASEFMAQYTIRQEYRHSEAKRARPDRSSLEIDKVDVLKAFSDMEERIRHRTTAMKRGRRRRTTTTTLSSPPPPPPPISPPPLAQVRELLRRAAAFLCRSEQDESAVAHHLVSLPFALFTDDTFKLAVSIWLGVMEDKAGLETRILAEVAQQWEFSIQGRLGLFSPTLTDPDPFFLRQEFAPSDLEGLGRQRRRLHELLAPHRTLLHFLSSHYNATRLGKADTQPIFLRMLDLTLDALRTAAVHPMAREIWFQIVLFGLRVLKTGSSMAATVRCRLKDAILSAGLAWFRTPAKWSFGGNLLQVKTEMRLISDVLAEVRTTSPVGLSGLSAHAVSSARKENLLLLLLESEQARLTVWVYPLADHARPHVLTHHGNKTAVEAAVQPLVSVAWAESPSLAVRLVSRFPYPRIHDEVRRLLLKFPSGAVLEADALSILMGGLLPDDVGLQLKYLLFWAPVNPLTAATYLRPAYGNHPYVVQYAMRALESYSVDVTFFYVPQIVQMLRYDVLGYVERYILETARFSPLFAHQIIWNMKANAYRDEEAKMPDPIKPRLDRVTEHMIESFSPLDRGVYEREFAFFDEVTAISGKLKPLLTRPKPEKKQKIEEELRRIKVEVGVYLPSNPDGVVIGIDRKSGKPLQSHAKAPFMATFRIRKPDRDGDGDATVDVWQSAIFKVGDDCRQDVLALQMMAAFRGLFHSAGLDVFLFPYRVTATAPGCGVIDVLPHSISRDMLGREAVNGLYDYFVSRYGNEDSLRFQKARGNFVKSMAAYSIISFLLQLKDRHNGNIMLDEAGHILHIDFGFCFNIAPGGIRFERAPFKLTPEMVAVMGGRPDHPAFIAFEELTVKAFLAARAHVDALAHAVLLMADSGLPCFRPETVRHFRDRFVLERSDREAADFVRDLIRKSASSYSTGLYDQFQLLTNGIPY